MEIDGVIDLCMLGRTICCALGVVYISAALVSVFLWEALRKKRTSVPRRGGRWQLEDIANSRTMWDYRILHRPRSNSSSSSSSSSSNDSSRSKDSYNATSEEAALPNSQGASTCGMGIMPSTGALEPIVAGSRAAGPRAAGGVASTARIVAASASEEYDGGEASTTQPGQGTPPTVNDEEIPPVEAEEASPEPQVKVDPTGRMAFYIAKNDTPLDQRLPWKIMVDPKASIPRVEGVTICPFDFLTERDIRQGARRAPTREEISAKNAGGRARPCIRVVEETGNRPCRWVKWDKQSGFTRRSPREAAPAASRRETTHIEGIAMRDKMALERQRALNNYYLPKRNGEKTYAGIFTNPGSGTTGWSAKRPSR